MKKRIMRDSLASTGLLIVSLSGVLYSNGTVASEYCSSPKLYATNIRKSCDQLGANGMQALYQSSEFISGLKALEQASPAKDARGGKLGSQKTS